LLNSPFTIYNSQLIKPFPPIFVLHSNYPIIVKKLLLVLAFLGFFYASFAQNASIKGVVNDGNTSLIGARIMLMNLSDTSDKKFTISSENGSYSFVGLKRGMYIVRASYLGFQNGMKRVNLMDDPNPVVNISLKIKSDQIREVTVSEKAIAAVQKGDTSTYNANAFKTNPDANAEELLTKMPGVVVTDGKMQAQGEEVKRILVDGKPFFGEDPNAVLKNLPAEVIEKIEVFDRRSDQAQFTGFDDGNSQKTINIVTKPSFRNGVFGRVFAGANLDEQYKVGFNLNQFKDKRRLTLLYQSNNINEQNFAQEDLLGVVGTNASNNRMGGQGGMRGGPGGMRGGPGGGGNDASQFLVGARNGINITHAVGINYSDKWGKKIEVSGSYFYNYTDNTSTTFTDRKYITGSDKSLQYLEDNISTSKNQNHRFNLRLEYKIDTFNSIIVQPRLSFQLNEGIASIVGTNNQDNILSSQSTNYQNSDLTGSTVSLPVLYRRGFEKRGRTLSLNITPTYTNQQGTSFLLNKYYSQTDVSFNDSIDQKAVLDKNGMAVNSNVTYTEPLDTNHALILSYNYNVNYNNSDKTTNALSLADNTYSDFDTSLTNIFKSTYTTQSVGLGYRFQKKKLMLMLSANLQSANLDNDQEFPTSYNLNRTFTSVLPSAMMMYRIDAKRNVRMFYRSANNAPSVDQLQEVLNNTNSNQLSIGNANLKQDFSNFFVIRYSAVNAAKATSMFAFVRTSFTNNYIGNNSYVATTDTVYNNIPLVAGARLTRPVNLNGYLNINSLVSYGMPINKIKSNLNFNLSAGFSKTPSIVNDVRNEAFTPTYGLGIVWSSNLSKVWDFTISTQTNFTEQYNSVQTVSNNSFLNHQNKIKVNIMPWKGLVISSEVAQQIYEGLTDNFSQNFVLWNAGIGYKFLKKDAAEFRLTAFDLLNQNQAISRNFNETYTEDVITNILQQYLMLNFSYKFSSF
jgi:hypothetical protein